jgi:Ca-activated chloride channel homolog
MMEQPWYSIQWFSWDTLRTLHWAYPYFLYAIPAIPLLLWLRFLFHRRARQHLAMPYDPTVASADWMTRLRYVQPVAVVLALALVLMALARPQQITERADRYSEGIDIMLLLDISDSMLEKDLQPNRLVAARKMARSFIQGRLQDRIGLIIFAGEAFSLCPLTTDYLLLYAFLDDISSDMIRTAGTAIGSALAVAVNRMRDSKSESKVAILISDGDNTSGNLDPLTAARLARAYGVRIYTIAVGQITAPTTTPDSLGTSTARVDESELQNIAAASNGRYFRATDTNALRTVFGQINQLEKVKYRDVMYREVKDHYRVYLYWAVVLLLVALATKSTFMANILED